MPDGTWALDPLTGDLVVRCRTEWTLGALSRLRRAGHATRRR